MTTTTPINALPSPDDSSPNDPPIHFVALAQQLDDRLNARFSSTSARDTAYSGLTVPTGAICYVGTRQYVRSGGSWVAQAGYQGSGTTYPTSPVVGDTYFHTTLKSDMVYVGGATDGSSWRQTMVAQINTSTALADYVAAVAAGPGFHYDFLAFEVATRTLYVADSGTTLKPVSNHSLARLALTNTVKVNPDAALCTISIPAVPYASRVIISANGKAGFAASDANVSWDYDTLPSGATNVAADTTETVFAAAGKWVTMTHTLSMDLPANTGAAPRLVVRSDVAVYNRGGVTWQRGPSS